MSTSSKNTKLSDLYFSLKKEGAATKLEGRDDLSVTAGILNKLASQCSEAVFIRAVESGELPPLKLTKTELNLLKGGFGGNLNFYQQAMNVFSYFSQSALDNKPKTKVNNSGMDHITPVFRYPNDSIGSNYSSPSIPKPKKSKK